MCGIVGSFDIFEAADLAEKMSHRGTECFSISEVSLQLTGIEVATSEFNETYFSSKALTIERKYSHSYYIFHLQSPTSLDFSFHPAKKGDLYLWHNGQIDSSEHQKYKEGNKLPWDTQIFLDSIVEKDWRSLEDFQGSFACLLVVKKSKVIQAFRNAISPLNINRNTGTVCSIPFSGSEEIDPGSIEHIHLERVDSYPGSFNNTYNPFGV